MQRVSIITISFNQAKFLERNRISVRGQGPGVEHIIVDPGSTDGSRELIAGWAVEAEVVPILERDRGPADGLNRGVQASTGDIWMYLNADDELAPGAIAEVRRAHASVDDEVVIGNGWTIDETGAPIRRVVSDKFTPMRYAMSVGTVLQQGTSFKAAGTRGVVAFNEANRFNWDTEYLFDLYRRGCRFAYIDADLGYFRLQGESITMSGSFEKNLRAERLRLRSTVPGYRLLQLISPVARAMKRAKGSNSTRRFPGLVVS